MKIGKGISAKYENKTILCGNENYIKENNIVLDDKAKEKLKKLRLEGKASIIVAIEETAIGIIALSDTLRTEAKEVINSLNIINTKSVLLTGDNTLTAQHIAKQIGINEVRAELLPEQKVENIINLQQSGKTVCMIGDGVNDAPSLKTADVGIAMGSIGSDIAIEAADIALMSDDISKLPYLKKLSNATVKTIKISITLSMVINILAVFLSVIGVLTPTTGALVHNAGSCFVVLFAALLYDRKF
jgi:P-type E1-E2 ATPase